MRVLLIDFNPFMAPVTPISIGSLGAVLTAREHEVLVLSIGSTSRFSPASFAQYVRDYQPRLAGFGAYQRNLHHVRALARIVKEAAPGCRTVLGGPQATFLPDAGFRALAEFDFVSRGEGELVIAAVAEAIMAGEDGVPVPGTSTRLPEGGVVTGPALTPPSDLDRYPSPWLSGVLDPAALDEAILLTSRGCPYGCAFCYTPSAFGQNVRAHSVERVLDEIEFVARRGSGRLWFADPNFSFSAARVTEILEGVSRRGLKTEIWLETRADLLDAALIRLFKGAGVHTVAMGLESASANVYPYLDKKLDPACVLEAVRLLQRAGIDVELFSQFALPRETLDDALATLGFVRSAGVKIRGNSNAQQLQIYFGSKVAADPAAYGVKPLRETYEPYLSIGTEFETDWMTKAEIGRVKDAWRAESLDGGKRVVS